MKIKAVFAAAVAAALGLAAVVVGRGQGAVELAAGDAAPSFSLPGSDGRTHSLEESRGRAVVLAWFPKAFTGG